MLMRTFLLVITSMAATVSCLNHYSGSIPVPAPPAVSVGCYDTSVALSTSPNVSLAESYIIQGGCQNFNFDITSSQCIKNVANNYRCDCVGTLLNTSSWEYAVGNISSGRPCSIEIELSIVGIKVDHENNEPDEEVEIRALQSKYDVRAFGGSCNTTEISSGLEGDVTEVLGSLEYSSLNVNSSVTGVTWNYASVTIYACDRSSQLRRSKQLIPDSNTGATTNTTNTNTTIPSNSGSGSSSNSSSSTNSNSTSTLPPVTTPIPTNNSSSSSSSSSTGGGKGTGTSTGNGNGNGASVMVNSATAVMVTLISAAVAIIKAA